MLCRNTGRYTGDGVAKWRAEVHMLMTGNGKRRDVAGPKNGGGCSWQGLGMRDMK